MPLNPTTPPPQYLGHDHLSPPLPQSPPLQLHVKDAENALFLEAHKDLARQSFEKEQERKMALIVIVVMVVGVYEWRRS
jgi:hypothetical protein